MSDTPILSKFLASKPGIWRDWTSRDFHELEGFASRFEKDRARLREALGHVLKVIVQLQEWQDLSRGIGTATTRGTILLNARAILKETEDKT